MIVSSGIVAKILGNLVLSRDRCHKSWEVRPSIVLFTFNCRRLNWDTVSQPVNDLFELKIQPYLPKSCQISALFRTQKSPKSPKPYTVIGNNLFCDFKIYIIVHDRRFIYRHTLQWLPSRYCILMSISSSHFKNKNRYNEPKIVIHSGPHLVVDGPSLVVGGRSCSSEHSKRVP